MVESNGYAGGGGDEEPVSVRDGIYSDEIVEVENAHGALCAGRRQARGNARMARILTAIECSFPPTGKWKSNINGFMRLSPTSVRFYSLPLLWTALGGKSYVAI